MKPTYSEEFLWSFCNDQWEKKFLLHILFKWCLTLLPFSFNVNLSALTVIDEILVSNFLDFNSEAKSTIVFATLSGGPFQLKQFVPTWSIKWFGFVWLKGYVSSGIHCVVSPVKVLTKALHFGFRFFLILICLCVWSYCFLILWMSFF